MNQNFVNSILGVAVGDALGVPVEFQPRHHLKKYPVKDMIGHGVHDQPAGTWSDDSSMMFCTMDAMITKYSKEKIAENFVKWVEQGFWTPHGRVFDIGVTTMNAIKKIKNGDEKTGGENEFDNGNGSLMRIIPLAFFLKNVSKDEKVRIIHEVSEITHAHAISKMSCVFYVEFAINLMSGISPTEAYSKTIEFFKSVYSEIPNCFDRLLKGNIHTLPENEIQSKGFVVFSLEVSIYCLLNSKNFQEAVLKAINLGEDTDTNGAITGGLAGLYFDSIPQKWVNKLSKLSNILSLCNDFYAMLLK